MQLCGDAHVQNLGSFAAPDGKLVFDLNDFDETIRGPWEWDVKRMAASIVLAGRESGHDRAACRSAAEAFALSYCRSMDDFSRLPVLEMARRQMHREERVEPIHAALRQSERARPLDLLKKFTEPDGRGQPRFRNQRPLFWRVRGPDAQAVVGSFGAYRETLAPDRRHFFDLFRLVDVGFKVVGTGSVGLRDYVALFEGNGPRTPCSCRSSRRPLRPARNSCRTPKDSNRGGARRKGSAPFSRSRIFSWAGPASGRTSTWFGSSTTTRAASTSSGCAAWD